MSKVAKKPRQGKSDTKARDSEVTTEVLLSHSDLQGLDEHSKTISECPWTHIVLPNTENNRTSTQSATAASTPSPMANQDSPSKPANTQQVSALPPPNLLFPTASFSHVMSQMSPILNANTKMGPPLLPMMPPPANRVPLLPILPAAPATASTSTTTEPKEPSSVMVNGNQQQQCADGASTVYEPVLAEGSHMLLPAELLRDPDYLKEVFSQDTWENVLTEEQRRYLKKFLPNVTEDEKNEIVVDLFAEKNFFFGNDKTRFVSQLLEGYYHPHVTIEREQLRKLQQLNDELDAKLHNNLTLAKSIGIDIDTQLPQQQTQQQQEPIPTPAVALDNLNTNNAPAKLCFKTRRVSKIKRKKQIQQHLKILAKQQREVRKQREREAAAATSSASTPMTNGGSSAPSTPAMLGRPARSRKGGRRAVTAADAKQDAADMLMAHHGSASRALDESLDDDGVDNLFDSDSDMDSTSNSAVSTPALQAHQQPMSAPVTPFATTDDNAEDNTMLVVDDEQ